MRLYKTTFIDDEKACPAPKYDSSAGDASKRRTALKKEGMREIVTVEVDVATDKKGLLAYLNGETN